MALHLPKITETRVHVSAIHESNYGQTAKVAEAVTACTRAVRCAEVDLFKVGDDGGVDLDALTASDTIVFGSPIHNGAQHKIWFQFNQIFLKIYPDRST